MKRTLLMLTAALLFSTLFAHAARAQEPTEEDGRMFTAVELDGWDLSAYNEKVQWAVLKAGGPRAGARERRAAAAALAARGNFFRDQGLPQFYKYALGDFRHAARFRPGDRDSKRKADEIESIYKSMGRPVPQFGNTKSGDAYLVELYVTKPTRISLEPGKSYANSGAVSARIAYVYEFDARAGQTLSASVRTEAGKGKAVFDIYEIEFRGRRRAFVLELESGRYTLPLTGKYLIRVYSKAGTAEFILKVGLD